MNSVSIELEHDKGLVSGQCASGWQTVVQRFADNFNLDDEVGASLCIIINGEEKVNIWGGKQGLENAPAWQPDSLGVVFSCTKGATALCAHKLIDEGKLELHKPVKDYWPEFARGTKADTTVAMMLDHSVGLPGFRELLKAGAVCDWDYMIHRLEAEEPFWQPGTRYAYHAVTYGWLVGELVRRVSGKSLGQYFNDEIAAPRGIPFWIGLPEHLEDKVVPYIPFVPEAPVTGFQKALFGEPESLSATAVINTGGYNLITADGTHGMDSRAVHAAEIGGAGGITNALGLARMYSAIFSGEQPLLCDEAIASLQHVSTARPCDAVLKMPTRFATGFM